MLHGAVWSRARRWATASIIAAAAVPSVAATTPNDPFVEESSGVTVDWRRGAISAIAGAAADHRMPSADAARPGAERRARVAARARIAEALRKLPLGGGRRLDEAAVVRAADRARMTSVDYQSNGGARVRLEVAFGAWEESRPSAPPVGAMGAGPDQADRKDAAPLSLLLPQAHLAAAPVVIVGDREMVLAGARYAIASGLPSDIRAVPAHADRQGRLSIDSAGDAPPDLAGRHAVIYVQKVLR